MRVIKRNGAEVEFDIVKIIAAVTKANDVVDEEARMTPVQIQRIAESVEFSCQSLGRAPTVEEIQDFVEHQIMAHGAFEVAKRYITYRYNRSLVRKSNTTDDKILSLIECNNEEAKQENSNKNPVVNSTQRDYMAGEVSRDLTNRLLLPEILAYLGRSISVALFLRSLWAGVTRYPCPVEPGLSSQRAFRPRRATVCHTRTTILAHGAGLVNGKCIAILLFLRYTIY